MDLLLLRLLFCLLFLVNLLECLVKVVTHTIQQFNRATCYSGHWSIPTISTRNWRERFIRLVSIAPPQPPSYPLLCMLFHTLLTGYACTSGGYRMSRNRTLMARIPTHTYIMIKRVNHRHTWIIKLTLTVLR